MSSGCDANSSVVLANDPNIAGTIVMLDRGGCHFTSKVWHAQQAGAIGAIVVDNLGVCGSGEVHASPNCAAPQCNLCPIEVDDDCQCSLRYMADDGDGAIVKIPSFLVSREDGASILARGTTPGQLTPNAAFGSMAWDLPNPDGQVEYSMWTHSNDANAYKFRESFE
jgi:hypothetical protein